MTPVAPAERRWFFGPATDLLLGCGLLYVVFFLLQSLAGPELRTWAPYAWLPLLTLLFGAPHYGATLLRVYEQRADRRKYAFFAVYVTAALLGLFVGGLHSALLGSILVTVYVTWSPWHYSGQNYGIALLFLRRRGVAIPARAKRLLYLSFVLSYLLTFLALHGATGGTAYAPASYDGTIFRLLSLDIPASVHVPLFTLVELAYIVCLAGAGWLLLPLARARDLAPTAAVLLSQALWFSVPAIAIQSGAFQALEPFRSEHRTYAFMWVALGHFLQYLWITTYYAAASESRAGRLRYLGKTLLAGTALWVFPTVLFAPTLLGPLPFDLGLALLTASVVNIHHFILDGAIWKLRDGVIAKTLLRSPGDPGGEPSAPARPAWIARGVFALGAFCWVVSLGLMVDYQRARAATVGDDSEPLRAAYERRAWFGRDSPRARLRLAHRAARAGDLDAALLDVQRSLSLYPTVDAFLLEASLHRRRGDLRGVRDALDGALALAPDDPDIRAAHARAQGE